MSGNSAGAGGALYNLGWMSLDGVMLVSNSALWGGGGVASYDTIFIEDSWVTGNTSDVHGGGIVGSKDVSIIRSTVSSNYTGGMGGGLYLYSAGLQTISQSAFYDNEANGSGYGGGGFLSVSDFAVDNSTISDNRAPNGWGGGLSIVEGAALTLSHVSVIDNQADSGGGIQVDPSSSAYLMDTILAFNLITSSSAPSECSGALTSLDHNIIYDTTGCGWFAAPNDLTGDPNLDAWIVGGMAGSGHYLPLASGQADGSGGDCAGSDQLGVARAASCDRGPVEGP